MKYGKQLDMIGPVIERICQQSNFRRYVMCSYCVRTPGQAGKNHHLHSDLRH